MHYLLLDREKRFVITCPTAFNKTACHPMPITTSHYRPLQRDPTLADRAMAHLQELIVSGTFPPGHRLPSEHDLAALLEVSRTVVREALRGLCAKGLVRVKDGAGAFVQTPSPALVSELLTLCLSHGETGVVTSRHIFEIRRMLEIEVAGLAARRRDEADLAKLRQINAAMANAVAASDWARSDYEFHDALAVSSKNPLIPVLLRSIADVLLRVRVVMDELPETREKARYHHEQIFAAVQAGSARLAKTAMATHLREVEAAMTQALAKQGDSAVKRTALAEAAGQKVLA